MSKKIILKISTPEQDIGEEPEFTFFEDNTYRCTHWDSDDYSEWKLEDGSFWVKHANRSGLKKNGWLRCAPSEEPLNKILYDKLMQLAIDKAFEVDVLDESRT